MTRKRSFFAVMLSIAMILGGLVLPSINTGIALTAEASGNTEYHAYLYFETLYSFRTAWDNESYGLYGSENTTSVTYDKIHTWDWGLTSAPGTFVDATITGDGTYTVSVSGLDWDEDEFSFFDDAYRWLGVSTDIPWYIADVTVNKVVIGNTVFENPEVYNEGTDGDSSYNLVDVENWDYGLSLGDYDATSSKVSITFTVSGLSSTGSSATTSTVTKVNELTPELTNNVGDQDYSTWSSTVKSYLVSVDSGYMRVEYTDSNVVVEYYDKSFSLTSKLYVKVELPLFGGFYAGEDAYYLVFGQTNYDEDDDVEVIRVVKYSKSWVRQGQASLCGANTVIPFDAGSLRMDEYNGFLYIRTSHEMYTSSDGLNHQANLTVIVDESCMKVINYKNAEYYDGIGYTSHSFNQFILIDDGGYIVAADHGDAYPRAVALIKSVNKAGTIDTSTSRDRVYVLPIEGETGVNYTGVSLGGLGYSSSSYLLVGNSVDQDENYKTHSCRNIFVGVVSKDDVSDSGTTVNWITNYDTDGSVTTSTPQLVKVGDDAFLLLWTASGWDSETSTYFKKLNYVFLDGKGNTTSKIYEADGQLSDCQPIFTGSEVVWYVTGNAGSSYGSSKPYFYSIDLKGNLSLLNTLEGDINLDGSVDYLDAMTALRYDAELISLTSLQLSVGDVNNDGSVNSLDAILILRYDAGLIDSFE